MVSPTPEQIKAIIEDQELTQPRASELALVGISTLKRYMSGETKMHPYVWKEFRRLAIIENQNQG